MITLFVPFIFVAAYWFSCGYLARNAKRMAKYAQDGAFDLPVMGSINGGRIIRSLYFKRFNGLPASLSAALWTARLSIPVAIISFVIMAAINSGPEPILSNLNGPPST